VRAFGWFIQYMHKKTQQYTKKQNIKILV
jgi:hypothetical protein